VTDTVERNVCCHLSTPADSTMKSKYRTKDALCCTMQSCWETDVMFVSKTDVMVCCQSFPPMNREVTG
ncbi:MAG: hypothetical protein RLZ62_2549, partial [Bacteroidota bacterium]